MSLSFSASWPGLAALVISLLFSKCTSAFVLEGSKTSYAQFRKWSGGGHTDVTFEFRTDSPSGLLLYTDDSGNCDFLELKLVNGALRLRYNYGAGSQILTVGEGLDKGVWHKVAVTRRGNTTILSVGQFSKSAVCTGHDHVFGNLSTNSYLFVGGLPSWYSNKLKALALPSVAFEPRFRGSLKNLFYTDTGSSEPKKQEMMAYKGVRASTVDACNHQDPCQHGGQCISTDSGPICDCDNTDYKGIFCEKESPPPEATFRGREFLKYDLNDLGGEAIVASQDTVSFYFKTRKSSGLLFYNSHRGDYLSVALDSGGVSLAINLGSGKLSTEIKPNGERFNDNVWHQVTIRRKAEKQKDGQSVCKVTMTVDGKFTERWKTVGQFNYLSSSRLYVGGTDGLLGGTDGDGTDIVLPGTQHVNNLVGCMKKVVYQADSVHLNLVGLAQEGNPLLTHQGQIEFVCQDVVASSPLAYRAEGQENTPTKYLASYYLMQQGGVISFSDPEAFLALPSWKSTRDGSIAVKIRTTEPNGLLMYNGGNQEQSKQDYFGLEMLDGFLFIHLELGSGPVKIRASRTARQLSDGDWHKVELRLNRNHGQITIDGDTEEFETPGENDELDLGGSFYVGGLDHMEPNLKPPTAIWSAALKYGFVGCIRDLVINGASIDIVGYAHEQNSGSIRSSCHTMPRSCHDRPCMHGGACTEGWNRYICDCHQTSFTGPTCSRGASTVQFTGSNFIEITLKEVQRTEAHDISVRFRTTVISGLLFLARSETGDKLEITLDGGRIRLYVRIGETDKSLFVGQSLNDDLWHTVKMKRRGRMLEGFVDDETPSKIEAYGMMDVMPYKYYHIGGISPRTSVSSSVPNFEGRLQQLVVNGVRLVDESHLQEIEYEGNPKFQHIEDSVHSAISFTSQHTYLGLPQLKAYNNIDIYFQFKTVEDNGLIMYNAGKDEDFLAVELINGHIHYTFNMGYGPVTLKDNAINSLSDNKYHSVWIRRPTRYQTVIVIDNYHKVSAAGLGDNYHLNLDGILFLGGVRSAMYANLPQPLVSKFGFQGCLASLELGIEAVDPTKDALVTSPLVSEGCEGLVQPKDCTAVPCANHGICTQAGSCHCDQTSFMGTSCTQESVAYEWSGQGGIIQYTYPKEKRPDTKSDILTMGFISPMSDVVLARVDSAESSDYLELKLIKGNVFINYNLGTEDIAIGDVNVMVNDGQYHVVRFTRTGPNSTIQVDDNPIQQKNPDGRHLTVFNSQSSLQLGGRSNEMKRRVEQPFQGVISGVVYNSLRPLDLAADRDPKTSIKVRPNGNVKLLPSIPFDYKEKNQHLFNEPGVQGTRPASIQHYTETGSGEVPKSGTSSQPGIHFNEGGFMPCEDDEDLCDFGSGAGDPTYFYPPGTSDNQSQNAVTTSYPSSVTTTTTTIKDNVWKGDRTTSDNILDGNGKHWQKIGITDTTKSNKAVSEKGFSEKYNVTPEPENFNPMERNEGAKSEDQKPLRGMSGTMMMVIGIILGSFIFMFLSVVIVLKVRTGVDISEYKQEEMQRYQFSSPTMAEREDYANHNDTASTSLIDGTTNVNNNSFFNGGLSTAFHGDRARLFKKANSCNKPVREWYV